MTPGDLVKNTLLIQPQVFLPIKYQKLVGKVIGNLSQDKKLVSSPNEGIEDHLRQPNGQKTRFLVKLATKMAPLTRLPLVGDIRYQKLFGYVIGNLSQHKKLVSSPNEGIEDHLVQPMGRKLRILVKLTTKRAPVTPWWLILSIKNWFLRSVGTYTNIRSWSSVQIKGLKLIYHGQMAKN